MKTLKSYILTVIITASGFVARAQTVNWAVLDETNKNIAGIAMGVDYGVSYGLSYGHSMKVLSFPVIAGVEFSLPAGDKRIDDNKSKIGGQIRWIEYRNFQFSTRIQGVFRRYDNDFVRMLNFGSDLAGVAGYYKGRWFVAGEVGFDKAIVTHLKHTDLYRAKYESVVDGWYEPSSGGNFYYGIQGGFNYKQHGVYLKAGKVLTQDFKTKPMIPYYGQVGYTIRF
jgi:hypothetical protein